MFYKSIFDLILSPNLIIIKTFIMKKVAFIALAALTISFTSCRDDKKTETEAILEEAQDNGAEIDIEDDGDKIKIENPDGSEVKIKTDDDGDLKIKTDDN